MSPITIILIGLCLFLSMYNLFYSVFTRNKAPTIPDPPAPPEYAPESVYEESDYDWMTERFPIGTRVDYLTRVLSVGRHDHCDSGWCGSLCEYVDDRGRIREIMLNASQLRAIVNRDESKPSQP